MTRSGAGAAALAAVLTLGACGTTFVDETVPTVDTTPDATTGTTTPIDPDAPLPELLASIEELMSDLDQVIVDDDVAARDVFARIDALWAAAEPRIRAADPDDVFNFEQAIELARTAAERRRPGDASKGARVMTEVVDAYLAG